MEKLAFLLTMAGFKIDDAVPVSRQETVRWRDAFLTSPYDTLYSLGFQGLPDCFDACGRFLCQLAEQFTEDLSRTPGLELTRQETEVVLGEDSLELLLDSVPFVLGSEFVTEEWLYNQYQELLKVFRREIAASEDRVEVYLADRSQKLHVPERIFFHLVENREGEDSENFPFAFLATYATRTENNRVRHTPLQYALIEFKGEQKKLLELLACLDRAAEVSPLINGFMCSGELFHPLRLTAAEAYQFLKDVPRLEATGILCRIPNWWKKRYSSVQAMMKVGEEKPSLFGMNALLSLVPAMSVGGVPLTEEDVRLLLAQTEGLFFLKGRWVEVDHDRLRSLLEMMEGKQGQEITLLDALRMTIRSEDEESPDADMGVILTNGKWLSDLLQSLRNPGKLEMIDPPPGFHGTLRPYQRTGFNWLRVMSQLGFGACLADDMGLGKTVQILAYLEQLRAEKPDARVLLAVPASLLGNWESETRKFAPELSLEVLHGASSRVLKDRLASSNAFLTITTYQRIRTIEGLMDQSWDCVILDEAQAIKNPKAKSTQAVKQLKCGMRIAMTGTPIENDLSNLWSLFDFLDKGLLGSSGEFAGFCNGLEQRPEGYARLKNMISPFLLRRVKTDRRIISDLPDKLERVDHVEMSKKQIVLYRDLLKKTENKLLSSEGMERRGLVLSLILHLKQICNHPDQFLGQQEYSPAQSGKFLMLKDLAETVFEKRERMLVFTQFREITKYLDDFLYDVFGIRGGVIHGQVPVAERTKLVERFQSDAYMPYMILSVKAGGTGLNLTRANHVVHFDRWWNPAVENQATDRAFRIGQQKNVYVHKFVCQGSVEEKIDTLINSKKELAENVIGSGGEKWITELGNDELMSLLRLD